MWNDKNSDQGLVLSVGHDVCEKGGHNSKETQQNFLLDFVIIVGPFYTTPTIIVHGLHIFISQQSLPHRKIKFKWIEKRPVELMSLVHAEASTGYLNPSFDFREQGDFEGKCID